MTTSDQEIHERMEAAYAEQKKLGQAYQDERRRQNHFQCRLDPALGAQLRHYMESRDLNANQALHLIVSHFFNNQNGN